MDNLIRQNEKSWAWTQTLVSRSHTDVWILGESAAWNRGDLNVSPRTGDECTMTWLCTPDVTDKTCKTFKMLEENDAVMVRGNIDQSQLVNGMLVCPNGYVTLHRLELVPSPVSYHRTTSNRYILTFMRCVHRPNRSMYALVASPDYGTLSLALF